MSLTPAEEQEQAVSPWRNWRRWLPGVLISLVALFLVLRLARWQDLSLAFSSIRLLNLLVAVALTVISIITRAAAWRILLDGKVSLRRAFLGINEGYFLNNLFPLRAGEFGRAVFVGKAAGLSPFHVLSTIVIERAFDLAMAATLLLITLPLAFGQDWLRPLAWGTLVLVLLGLGLLFLMARNTAKVEALLNRWGQRWPKVGKFILPKIGSLLEGLSALTRPSQFFGSLLWIALSWVLWVLLYYIMLLPIAPQAPLWWGAFADAVLAMGVAIPSAPGALGVYEGALVWALSLFGISASTALAYAILVHFLQFVVTGLLGFYALLQEGRSFSALLSEIRVGGKVN